MFSSAPKDDAAVIEAHSGSTAVWGSLIREGTCVWCVIRYHIILVPFGSVWHSHNMYVVERCTYCVVLVSVGVETS